MKGIELIKSKNKSMSEWSVIYCPMVKYLTSSFLRLLEVYNNNI
jgi:hypothetical protein